ncbi:MAG: exosortase C-terminal domain/associated protein EpsI [Steroidobacteraceae bacterium]
MNSLANSMVLGGAMLLTAVAAHVLRPTSEVAPNAAALEELIPREFADWSEAPGAIEQVNLKVPTDDAAGSRAPYDDVLMRTYRRSDGQQVMLALAYGRRQRQEQKIHRPEICYYAQGFAVSYVGRRPVRLTDSLGVQSLQLVTTNRSRQEPVTYWIRIGNEFSESAWKTRWIIFRDGMRGDVPDGILVRASSIVDRDTASEGALQLQREFLSKLYAALSPGARKLVAGVE